LSSLPIVIAIANYSWLLYCYYYHYFYYARDCLNKKGKKITARLRFICHILRIRS